ncbi:predicted protein [Nematostella vectensis]|uniref:Uncharacterized protein n=1 Tax=Nematostella vectensis TaxID=45351 RepID=A7T6E2_NEMVE|nr:predicted protein [Nematostella vectensis]|eukprot:XP_001620563.1 hypothetical protein NEMVEDRAFT_v1g222981 [Nematostella vectensis]
MSMVGKSNACLHVDGRWSVSQTLVYMWMVGSLVNLPIDLTEENLSQSSLTKGAKNLPIIVEDRASVMSMRRDMRRKSLFRPSKDNLASRTTMPSENSFLQLPGSSSRLELRNRSSLELSPSSGQDTTGQTTPSVVQPRVSIRESNMTFLTGGNPNKKKRESCPVGRGAQFSRSLFDVHGHSPLVEQFLQMQRLAKNAGTGVLVQRTEIESLPPYPYLEIVPCQSYCPPCFY